MNTNAPQTRPLPHQRLIAYQRALELLQVVTAAEIRSARIRDQALRAAQSACMNIGEAHGRTSAGDKARVYGIARGEVIETAAAMEVALISGEITATKYERVPELAHALYAMLTVLAR